MPTALCKSTAPFFLILQKQHDRLRRPFARQMIERLLDVFRAGPNAVDKKHLTIRTEIEILQRGLKADDRKLAASDRLRSATGGFVLFNDISDAPPNSARALRSRFLEMP